MNNPANNSDLKIINGIPMMGSRTISDMTGKDHSSVVVRDIKNMLKQLNIYPAIPQDDENKSFFFKMKEYNGREVIDESFLDQDLSTTLVTGYSVQDRYKIIKRWGDLESGKAQPLIATQPPMQTEPVANQDILSLARVVAEATASATMKAVMEVSGVNLISATPTPAAPASPSIAESVTTSAAETLLYTAECDADGYIAVTKLSWSTSLSDPSCRHLIEFAALPTRKTPGIRGLMVHKESFMSALSALIDESEPPAPGRKRWKHSGFGCFALRKDPKEIFGEAE